MLFESLDPHWPSRAAFNQLQALLPLWHVGQLLGTRRVIVLGPSAESRQWQLVFLNRSVRNLVKLAAGGAWSGTLRGRFCFVPILTSQGHFDDMLTYFKFMPVSAEGLHGPPGARLKPAKGWGCHHVEIMLSYFDLCWFDYFWKALCPTNQSRFKFSCVCVSFFHFI